MSRWIILLIVVIMAFEGANYLLTKEHSSENPRIIASKVETGISLASNQLEKGNLLEASRELERYESDVRKHPDQGKAWVLLSIEVHSALENAERVLQLYDLYPDIVLSDEETALRVARVALKKEDHSIYQKIANLWAKEKSSNDWLLLQAHSMIKFGKFDSAERLLKSRELYNSSLEAERLVLLAEIALEKGQKNHAWQLVSAAVKKAPGNSQLHKVKGDLATKMFLSEHAKIAYAAAVTMDPKNPIHYDAFANFHLKEGAFKKAVTIWTQAPEEAVTEEMLLKVLFANRVTKPIDYDFEFKNGPLQELVSYVHQIEKGSFWNRQQFDKLSRGKDYLRSKQEIYWFRLLDLLKTKQEREALRLLNLASYGSKSWNPEIELQLKRVLEFRLDGVVGENTQQVEEGAKKHPLFIALDAISKPQGKETLPTQLSQLLKSDDAFAAVFLVGNWSEAALQLYSNAESYVGYPDWYAVGIANAINVNRSSKEALKWIETRTISSPELELLKGKILLTSDRSFKGEKLLQKIVRQHDSERAIQAAALLSDHYLSIKEHAPVKRLLELRQDFAEHPQGQKIQERIKLIE